MTSLKIGRRYRLTQQLTYGARVAPVGAMAEVTEVNDALDQCTARIVCDNGTALTFTNVPAECLELLVGKPYCAALGDAPRANFGGKVRPAASTPASETPAMPLDVTAALDTLRDALSRPAATVDLAPIHAEIEILDSRLTCLGELLAPALQLAERVRAATPVERERIALAARSSSNPILARLLGYYEPGTEAPANVCLAAPPSIGKTYAVRELGKGYDLYLEHGCTDDLDEVATLLGNPTPDGRGGFVIVDGVLTQAVRAAAEGQTVLLLLDEVFRLGERAQEFLLSFLTGVKTPAGRVYRLRTRRTDLATGALEVIECPVKNLHLVAATNLGARTPVEAFWSRWEVVRIPFDVDTVKSVAETIALSYGIMDAGRLATQFAAAVTVARAGVADGSLRYPLDLRALERSCQLAPTVSAEAVCKHLADRVSDLCAHWGIDSGETDPASAGTVGMVRAALGVA